MKGDAWPDLSRIIGWRGRRRYGFCGSFSSRSWPALVALDLVVTHHPNFDLDSRFGFGAWFGFLSCVVLIVFAKALGALLKRPDTYYDS